MGPPFRALHLPDLPLEKCLQGLNYGTLVRLACCSTDSAVQVSRLMRGVKAARPKMNVVIGDTWRLVEVVNADGRTFRWHSYSPRHPQAAEVENFVANRVFGVTTSVSMGKNAVYHVSRDFERDLVFWTSFLKLLFTCTMDSVTLSAKWDTNFKLILTDPLFFKSEKLIIRQFVMRHREFEFLLENYKTKHFICHGRIGCEFKYLKPIIFPNVVFERGTFLIFDNVMQMARDCEQVDIGQVAFDSDELNLLLKEWVESKSKLRVLVIRRAVDSEPLEFEEVLDEIETDVEPVGTRNVSEQFINEHRDRSSWSIKRADGLTATVYMVQQEQLSEFELHVWHPEDA